MTGGPAASLVDHFNGLSGILVGDLGSMLFMFAVVAASLSCAVGLSSSSTMLRAVFGAGGAWCCAWAINRITDTGAAPPQAPPPPPAMPEADLGGPGFLVSSALIVALPALSWAIIRTCEWLRSTEPFALPDDEPRAEPASTSIAGLVEDAFPLKVSRPFPAGVVVGIGADGITLRRPGGEVVQHRCEVAGVGDDAVTIREADGSLVHLRREKPAPAPPPPRPRAPSAGDFARGCALHEHRPEVLAAQRRIDAAFGAMRGIAPLGRRAERLLRRIDQDVGAWLLALPKEAPALTENMSGSLSDNARAAEALLADLIRERTERADIGAKVNRDRHASGELDA